MSIYCSQLQIQGEKGLQAEKLPFLTPFPNEREYSRMEDLGMSLCSNVEW
jgi:hypothetical protein